jgi:hypothetical protein
VNLTSIISLKYRLPLLCLLMVALVGFGWVKGARHVQSRWDAAEGVRARTVTDAIIARVAENKRQADRQAAINREVTERKDHEISSLTARLNAAGRMRVGTAVCGGLAAATETESSGSGNEPDSSGRMVREDVDRDLKALILAVEKDLATGRACQAFAKENGLAP